MLHPSYVELIDHVNNVNRENGDPEIMSRYTLVMAVAKRARDLVNGADMMVPDETNGRMLAQAVREMDEEKLGIVIREPEVAAEAEKADLADVDLSTSIEEE